MHGDELTRPFGKCCLWIGHVGERFTGGLRAQIEVIAQLNDRSVTEEIRLALEAWVETTKSDLKALQRAETMRAEIEREAKTKQSSIEAIFGGAASLPVDVLWLVANLSWFLAAQRSS